MKNRNVGLVLSYGNTFLNMICGLFLSSFLLNQLGDTEYGVYQTIASFVNYLILLEFGTGTVMARNLSQCRVRNASETEIRKNISTVFGIANILSVAIIIVSIGLYFSLEHVYSNSFTQAQIASGKSMFPFLTFVLVLNFYAQTINGIMLAHERYSYSASVSIARNLSRTLLLIVFICIIKKALLIVVIDTVVNLAIVVYGLGYCINKLKLKISIKDFDLEILKISLPFCIAMFLQTVVNQANSTVGKFILGVMAGPEEVALYSVGLYIYNMFSSLTTIPISLYLPQVTKDVVAGYSGRELTKKLVQPCRLIVIIGGAVVFGFIAVGRQFIEIVYGKEYLSAWVIAIVLMLPMFVNMSNAVVLNVLDVKNKRLARSLIMLLTTVINILITIVLIKKIGITGSAVATAISVALQVVLLNIYYSRVIGISVMYLFKKTFKGILVYQIIGALITLAAVYFVHNTVLAFLLGGILYVIISFGGFVFLGANKTELDMFNGFKNKIKNKMKRSQ